MDYEEAMAWLRGERSVYNSIPYSENGLHIAIQAQADAAMTQQAYLIVKAYMKGLLDVTTTT